MPGRGGGALLEQMGGPSISPPYRRVEEQLAAPAAALPDSAWPEDAAVARAAAARPAHRDGWFAAAEATECSAGSARRAAARPELRRQDSSSTAELSEPRPYQSASAVSVPKESGPASAQAWAGQESPYLSEPNRVQPDLEQRREQPASKAPPAGREAHEATESMAAKTVPSTMEDAAAEPAALARPQPPRHFSLRVLSRCAPQPALPPSARASQPDARGPAPARLLRGARLRARAARLPRRARAAGPAVLRRRRASWSASSCRQCPAPPTSRGSRWALLRARGPAH